VAVLVGARARDAERGAAGRRRYHLVATDYLNSYYGRLAVKKVEGRVPMPIATSRRGGRAAAQRAIVRALLTLDLYDQALDELRYAQRTWGDSPRSRRRSAGCTTSAAICAPASTR
jgi:hypothetical protein